MKHKRLSYVEGDLFKPVMAMKGATILLPHVCNNRGAFSAGFVVPLMRHFPRTRDNYLKWHGGSPPPDATYPGGLKFGLGATQVVQVNDDPRIIVFNMVAQEMGGPRPLFYNHLARCMDHVAEEHQKYPEAVIHCPMFGSGLSGGNFLFVEELIMDCWLRRGIPVTVYYLPNSIPEGWLSPT